MDLYFSLTGAPRSIQRTFSHYQCWWNRRRGCGLRGGDATVESLPDRRRDVARGLPERVGGSFCVAICFGVHIPFSRVSSSNRSLITPANTSSRAFATRLRLHNSALGVRAGPFSRVGPELLLIPPANRVGGGCCSEETGRSTSWSAFVQVVGLGGP